jgi:REP element-mobilizing transposase RayT
MPSRNVLKVLAPDSYYHVYARGASHREISLDEQDYRYFLGLFERYLSERAAVSKTGEPYPHFRDSIELVAFCLMSTHFHLLIWQKEADDLPKLMRSIMTSYSRYYNLRHKTSGALFESRYKASHIENDAYLGHISRYIHLNPRYWQRYPYSSLRYYFAERPAWLQPDRIEAMFASRADYIAFLKDYEQTKESLEEVKYSLADW